MKAQELRQKSQAELEETLLELRQEQFNLRMQYGTGQLTRTSEVTQVRKDIARVKTIMNEQQAGNVS